MQSFREAIRKLSRRRSRARGSWCIRALDTPSTGRSPDALRPISPPSSRNWKQETARRNRRKGATQCRSRGTKRPSRRYVEEVWKDEKLDIADEVFAETYLSHQSDGTTLERGPEDVKKFIMEYRSAFSDIEDIVEDMIGEGDRVATRWTLRVTHTGEFRGIPATGRRIKITGIGIFRFSEEGKVVESWDSLDQLGMLRQLGVSEN